MNLFLDPQANHVFGSEGTGRAPPNILAFKWLARDVR